MSVQDADPHLLPKDLTLGFSKTGPGPTELGTITATVTEGPGE